MLKHISKLYVEYKKSCLEITYWLFLIVFIITNNVALLSFEDNKKDENDKEVFSNKFVITFENKVVKKYILNNLKCDGKKLLQYFL